MLELIRTVPNVADVEEMIAELKADREAQMPSHARLQAARERLYAAREAQRAAHEEYAEAVAEVSDLLSSVEEPDRQRARKVLFG